MVSLKERIEDTLLCIEDSCFEIKRAVISFGDGYSIAVSSDNFFVTCFEKGEARVFGDILAVEAYLKDK